MPSISWSTAHQVIAIPLGPACLNPPDACRRFRGVLRPRALAGCFGGRAHALERSAVVGSDNVTRKRPAGGDGPSTEATRSAGGEDAWTLGAAAWGPRAWASARSSRSASRRRLLRAGGRPHGTRQGARPSTDTGEPLASGCLLERTRGTWRFVREPSKFQSQQDLN